jgi:hypothetical protein
MLAETVNPWATGVLHEEVHDRLVQDIQKYATDAAIQAKWIWTPLAEVCGPAEVDYAKRFRKHAEDDVYGLVYYGKPKAGVKDVDTRMSALAGCFTRNFIGSRVITTSQLLTNDKAQQITALLIPNFFLGSNEGGSMWEKQVKELFDILTARRTAGLQTIVYVSDLAQLEKEFGPPFRRLFENHYIKIKI